MRCFSGGLLIIFIFVFLSGCENKQNDEIIDVFFENGLIYTMDNRGTVSESMAVKDGEIVFLGTVNDGEEYKNKAREVVDLDGKIILPGFIDPYMKIVHKCFADFCRGYSVSKTNTAPRSYLTVRYLGEL